MGVANSPVAVIAFQYLAQRRGYFYMKLPRMLWAADTKRGCGLSRTYAYIQCKIIPSTHDPSAPMSIQEIEAAITKLSAEDLAILASWFAEYRAQTWDKQIERDLDAGRLDALLAEVDAEYEAGQAKPL